MTKQLLISLIVMLLVPFSGLARNYDVSFKQDDAQTAINKLMEVTGHDFVYQKELLNGVKASVNGNYKDASLERILNEVVEGQLGLSYKIIDNTVILRKSDAKPGQKINVTGVVTDENGEPVVGASVIVKGSKKGVSTDIDGRYNLSSVPSNSSISVSYIGYQPVLVAVKGRSNLNIALQPDQQKLDEVVVVGYGTSSVKDLTGSVASIGEKQLSQLNTTNVISMMQNLAAGVQVSQSTGQPGESVRVRVRGATSLGGSNEPLYVIDGIPCDSPTDVDAISPNDIKSMDVLKDASAAAIYGSRAANGVVIITTKKGTRDKKATVSASYNVTTDAQIQNYRILYGDEWRNTIRDFARTTLVYDPSNTYAKEILDPTSNALGEANTNWFDLVKQTAIRHNANISVTGGSQTSQYAISLSLFDQQGMIKGGDLKRYTARVSLESSILPILRIGLNANGNYSIGHTANTSLFTAQGYRPDIEPYDEDGSIHLENGRTTPLADTFKRNSSHNYGFMGTIYAELDIIKDLTFRTSLSGNVGFSFTDSFTPSYLSSLKENSGTTANSRSSKTIFDNTLTYKHTFTSDHIIDAMAGVSFEHNISRSTSISSKDYPDDDIFVNLSSATNVTRWSGGSSSKGLFSSFVRLNYRLMQRYLFTFTGRYDGSSMFGANHRYGFFPSGAIAWRINNEEFMKDITAIDDLKLRASIGTTGLQNLSNFGNRDLYNSSSYNGLPAIIHSQVGNRDIRWEKSTQYDLGVDFAILGNRMRGSLSGYIKDTNGLIQNFSFPSSTGGGSIKRNIGAVSNKGIELYLNGQVIRGREWNLDLTLNLARNKNKVKYLVEEGSLQTSVGTTVQGSGDQVLAIGYPMGSFLGYANNGIIQNWERVEELNKYSAEVNPSNRYYYGSDLKPGHVELVDVNGDGVVDTKDRVILGSPDPTFYGGITGNLSYKNFNLYANFGFQVGGKKIYSKRLQNVPGQLCGLIDYGLNDRWSDENPNAKLPALYIGDGVSQFTDYQLMDASFFRLQEVRLTYTLPFIKVVRGNIFFSATNLFTITSYPGTDPASVYTGSNYGGNYDTNTYPGFRSYSGGISINI